MINTNTRLQGLAHQPHPHFFRGVASFAMVAGLTGTDDVLPAMLATLMTGYNMV